ncbi:MAG TPA: cache domain-containing protein, partial [Aggregatilineales bacterium]|nr:cache domain-containing protein [Aggregatilineales bacterium]
RIEDAVTSVQSSLSDIQAQLSTDINVLTSDIAFFQAVGRRDATRIGDIIAQNNFDQTIYDIAVVDGDGNLLFSAGTHEIGSLSPQTLTQGARLVAEEHDGRLDIHISEAVPIVSVTGNVLGALEITRHLDENFLQELINEQRRVSIGLVYDREVVAESSAMPAILLLRNALTSDQITRTDLFTSSNIPYLGAYLPLVVNGNRTPATLLVFVELSELYGFQNSILGNTVIVFLLLMILTIGLIYLVLYQIVINPVNRLRVIAQEMTSGQYERRIPVGNRDE